MAQILLFPNGKADIDRGAADIYELVDHKIPMLTCVHILTSIKTLMMISQDKSPQRIIPSILARGEGKLTQSDGDVIYRYLSGEPDEMHTGGDGSSPDSAVIINATTSLLGVAAEYKYIGSRYGTRDVDWKVVSRRHGPYKNTYQEVFEIATSGGQSFVLHFDISAFFGKH